MTVGRLLEELGSSEVAEWIAFYQLEPFGGQVDDLRAGLVPALTVNMNRAENADPVKPMDFFPWHEAPPPEPEPEPESPEVIARRIKAEVFGVKDE